MVTTQLLIICLMLFKSEGNADNCPFHCACLDNSVHCNGINLAAIPGDLPQDTSVLDLENNDIKVIERHKLVRLSNLTELKLKMNQIAEIEPGTFNGLKTLTHLDLEANRIRSLSPGVFQDLSELIKLNLANNHLSSVSGALDGLVSLEQLSLQHNAIQGLDNGVFDHLQKLGHLTINNNNISRVESLVFAKAPKLLMLDLANNPLGNVDNIVQKNVHLNYLDLTNSSLTKFPAGLPWTLRYLQINKNNIPYLSKDDLMQLRFLSVIVLEENNLTEIEGGAFYHMGFLHDILLMKNNLTTIPGPFPQSVRSVYLDHNSINNIPSKSFQHGTNLNTLSIRKNNISVLTSDAFLNLRSINELHLENNPLSVLGNNTFSTAHGLTYLALNRLHLNTIETDVFYGLDNLTKLEMAFVDIPDTGIMGNIFQHLLKLVDLDLQESPVLARVLLSNVKSCPYLQKLNLLDNKLTTLPADMIKLLPALKKIQIAGNRFHCGSNLVWLKLWVKFDAVKFSLPAEIRCYSPDFLKGQSVMNVPVKDFHRTTTVSMGTASTADSWPNYYDFVTEQATMMPTTDYYNYHYYDYPDYHEVKEPDVKAITTDSMTTTQTTTNTTPFSNVSTVTVPITTQQNPNVTFEETADERREDDGGDLKSFAIGAGMTLAGIVIMLLIAALAFYLWRRKHNMGAARTRHCEQKNDYVFIISKKDSQTQPPQRKLTRQERGSTTSKASEDITNDASPSMKVFTLDD